MERLTQEIFREVYENYKCFEKCFLKADKTKDMIAYIKLKHQFRALMVHEAFALVPALYMLIIHHFFLLTPFLMLPTILIVFRTRSYNIMRSLIFILMVLVPPKYPPSNLVLVTPAAILFSNSQILIHTQSVSLMMLHLGIEGVGFYMYGMECIVAKIKEMSSEELAESAKTAIIYSFMMGFLNFVCLKLFYSQFTSLMRKVNTLKDNISKANTQLNDQNLKLQSNLEMKDVFIYTFSHELKNALNGLLGNLSLAYDTAKDAQVLQFLSSAKVCGEVLKNFVHNILDSGKLENGNLEVSPERKDVMLFLENTWTICGRIIQNKRLKGFLEIDKNVPRFLELDEQRMIQIILNLVSNAVKFTEKGQIRLRVRWQATSTAIKQYNPPEEGESQVINNNQVAVAEEGKEERETTPFGDIQEFPNGLGGSLSQKENHHLMTEYQKKLIPDLQSYQLNLIKSNWNQREILQNTHPEGSEGILKIQVIDSGCGMTSEDQTRLFQKFSQVSNIQGQRKVGTGLGLWICKELADRLRGDITTRSMVGVGSIFELTIRTRVSLIRSTPDQDGFNTDMRLSLNERRPNMLKILIADDDSFNMELMKNYLNKFGISYLCAYDGEEAVSLFKASYQQICFVITDNFMPKKTGAEAAVEIADFLEEKEQPQIPILCISGDLKVNVGKKGITSVIQKPINFDRLKEEIIAVYPQLIYRWNNQSYNTRSLSLAT